MSAWDEACRARGVLATQPAGTRSKAQYKRVIDNYRAIFDNPRDPHAAPSINAVAELLAEEGRQFDDAKMLRAALAEYEFLRSAYPGSPLHEPALLAEARLQRDDLGDSSAARERYALLVKESPRSEAGRAAKAEMAALGVAQPTHRDTLARNGPPKGSGRSEARAEADSSAGLRNDKRTALRNDGQSALRNDRPGGTKLAAVSGIRHWSTASYTRVAIDLGDEVRYEATRSEHPDRIVFDLHGAKLVPELAGKSFAVADDGYLKRMEAAQGSADTAQITLDVSGVTEYTAFLLPNPYRLIIDIHGKREQGAGIRDQPAAAMPQPPAAAEKKASAAANSSGLPAMAPTDGGEAVRPLGASAPDRIAREQSPSNLRVAPAIVSLGIRNHASAEQAIAPVSKPIAVVVVPPAPVLPRKSKAVVETAASPARAAERTAEGGTSLVRALGLKINRIVIDAGHGGHDSGTLGDGGIQEKDVVLDVALRVGKLLRERLGAEIIYTRSDDTFIPLETRTAIANKAQADLFLSIHANSSPDASARGVETYYLNFTSDPTALDVAARENAVSGQSVHQLSDLVKKIALKDKIAESREFAADVEGSLFAGLTRGNSGLRDRGVKKAPFVVLIGANMPSILAEISFVTNPDDADQLREPDYRQRVAESLYAGVAKYQSGLAGTKALPAVKRASLQ